ncbi:MAG TPA: winged helix-turn-helix transcriptional regulator [Candidatus Limnocylindrales bacterium]|nr:winged helix-turn-helix transcriptional regulator [Candidatus Limnocylindrales bacterium]
MDRHLERDLEILKAIDEGLPLTQRALAERLGVALGLTNLYLKRLAGKGLIKVRDFARKPAVRKRLRYVLTPQGVAEKTRLTYEYMGHSLQLFRRTRENLRASLAHLPEQGVKRIALFGTGEAAELAYLTLKELGLEPVAVFAPHANGQFLGLPVRGLAELETEDIDRLIIASFDRPEPLVAELSAAGVPRECLVTIRQLAQTAAGTDTPA